MRPATRIHPERETTRTQLSAEQEQVIRSALERYCARAVERLAELVECQGRQSLVALGAAKALVDLSMRVLPQEGQDSLAAEALRAVQGQPLREQARIFREAAARLEEESCRT